MPDRSRASNTLPAGAGFTMSIVGKVNATTIAAEDVLKKCMVVMQTIKIESRTTNDSNGSEVIEVSGKGILIRKCRLI